MAKNPATGNLEPVMICSKCLNLFIEGILAAKVATAGKGQVAGRCAWHEPLDVELITRLSR